jgi:nucleoside-diphosphate-sugar epimerase
MTILLWGGSGQIGHFLLPRLRARGEPVLAVSRRPRAGGEGLRWIDGWLPDGAPSPLPPLSAVLSCGPLDGLAHWLERAELPGRPRVVATGSMSAQSKRDSPLPAERELAARLLDAERRLAAACAARGCAWTVLRPTLVYGAGLDQSLSPWARRAARSRVFPLPLGRGLRQPVHADDIAQAFCAALDAPQAHGRVIPIGGGERLSAARMFARVRRSLPVWTLPLPLPMAPLRLAARALPRLRGVVERFERDLVADNGPLETLLGVKPRGFETETAPWWPRGDGALR